MRELTYLGDNDYSGKFVVVLTNDVTSVNAIGVIVSHPPEGVITLVPWGRVIKLRVDSDDNLLEEYLPTTDYLPLPNIPKIISPNPEVPTPKRGRPRKPVVE